ncbi:hypothetical protein VPK21_004346 [Sinorhizobium kummerowiae]|uniref:Uncharacterized protein n=1 Tax=Sinorhizobium kummerowiae TaxID=158892 RepID=A0ABY8TD58_9HYPH|nr:hypothetical protein [Sinorhizobium kummerowiae]WHS94225.1 hypothetical protein PZL22_001930 [Sinorhizobium kummerowiae]WRW46153.1 hypothetical protein VPK21_004346 [Sinorhizobium kummerowiae]
MISDDRVSAVKAILSEFVRSPSLRHVRDPHSLDRVSRDIVKCLDREHGVWQKWTSDREALLKLAVGCWIPIETLREYLNGLPGPPLTMTDVGQRLRVFEEEPYANYPDEDLRDGCLAIFAREKAEGTELPAIVGLLSEYVEAEQQRIRLERAVRYKRMRAEERQEAEQRLLSGADCGWTQIGKASIWYCRKNGRTFRLKPTPDKRWEMHRIDGLSAEEKGKLIGRYGGRGDATKVVAQIAYQPEARF